MKRVIVLSAITLFIGYAASAQSEIASLKKDEKSLSKEERSIRHEKKGDKKELHKIKQGEVSNFSIEAFQRDYGIVPGASWRREGNLDVVTFTKDGVTQSAYYDFDAQLVGTTMRKSFSDIPMKAQTWINEKYPGYSKTGVILFDDNENNETDMVLYGQSFDDADNYFVELAKGDKKIVLKSTMAGEVSYFTEIK